MIDYVGRTRYAENYVVEDHGKKRLDESLDRFLDRLCHAGLSTCRGRIEATKRQLGFKSMVPIYVREDLLLMPLRGLRGEEALLVNYHAIRRLGECEKNRRTVTFFSGHVLTVPKRATLDIQIAKCRKIIAFLSGEHEEKKMFSFSENQYF